MATTDQLRRAEQSSGPRLNDFQRQGWKAVLRAMDMAKFGEPREAISWKHGKLYLYVLVCRRISNGEPFPSRDAIAKAEGRS